jgi:glutamate dehydrogenase/leucine dehydrogenase
MRKGLDKHEVLSLAKTMEIKFTVSGPQIGGAKSGINFDPADPRKKEVLERWYAAVTPLLKHYYGTGGDLNVDEIHEVIPITEDCGVWHPQEGVFNGHFMPTESQKVRRIGNLRRGVIGIIEDHTFSPDVERKYKVADMITGFGVAESVRHYYEIWNSEKSLSGKKVIVQGWGNVGAAAAFYMAQHGAHVVGIIDRNGGLINENGFSFEEIRELFLTREGNTLVSSNLISFNEINEKIWNIQADIFLPCAASRLVTQEQAESMFNAGVRVIACGANVPFADSQIFYGPISEWCDERFSVIPDFISNCGMARVFAYLMSEADVSLSDAAIFSDTSKTIKEALKAVYQSGIDKTKINARAFEIALKKLM